MSKNDKAVSVAGDKVVTIKGVALSKLHSRYTLTIKEERGKLLLEHDDYRYLIKKFGTYTGHWRGEKIAIDKDYKVVKV